MENAIRDIMVFVVSELNVEQIDLIIENFHTDQNSPLVGTAAAHVFFNACVGVSLYLTLMSGIQKLLVETIEKEWEQHQIVIVVLK